MFCFQRKLKTTMFYMCDHRQFVFSEDAWTNLEKKYSVCNSHDHLHSYLCRNTKKAIKKDSNSVMTIS